MEIHVKSILPWVSARFELARVRVIGSQLYMYWKVRIKFNDSSYSLHVGCATDETKLWLSLSAKQCRNPCSGSPPVYQDLSMHHDWPVKKAIVDFSNRLKGNWNCFSANLLSQDLSLCHDWPVKKAIVDLSNRLKGNSKLFLGNSLSPLGAQNKDFRHCFTDVTNWG